MSTSLLIRADATAHIGTGHIMRCLALAQMWQADGGQVHFLLMKPAPAIESRLIDEGMAVHYLVSSAGSGADASEMERWAQAVQAHWVVVDGYHFDGTYQQRLKAAGLQLLCLDDYGHAGHYYADLVLNQNIYADARNYPNREPYTRLLLGTRYVLLRREFWPWRDWQREIPEVGRTVLVTLGGADAANVTLKVIHALQLMSMPDLVVTVVVGGSNPHYAALEEAVAATPWIRLARNVTNMPELMAWADVAIAAGGSTCWELAFMGLPGLLLVLADNQRAVVRGVTQAKVAVGLGKACQLGTTQLATAVGQLLYDVAQRRQLSQNGSGLIDGRGSQRVMNCMRPRLHLRAVQVQDSHLIWEWANDGDTRAASFSSTPISWATHETWFAARLTDPQCRFYIAVDVSGSSIGQIRYQLEGESATVSVSVAPEYRGQGYSVRLIQAGTESLFVATAVMAVHAYIKPDNLASRHAFARAGFTELEPVYIEHSQALHFIYNREKLT